MSGEALDKQDLLLELAHKKFLCQERNVPGVDVQALKKELLDTVLAGGLLAIYEHLAGKLGWQADPAVLASISEKNTALLAGLENKIKDAEENLGETEVRDALLEKAEFLRGIGDKEAAISAYQVVEEKTAGVGSKVDVAFSQIRLLIFYEDWPGVKKLLSKAKQLCEEGGDWERKNKLKVYQATFSMYARDFKTAADLFLDSIATFTTSELFPYSRCIFYAVVTSMVALDRVALKKRVVDSPEILSVIDQTPHLSTFLNSLYFCKYKDFFKAFVGIVDLMRADMYLSPHIRYYMREVRVAAYAQFLESYKSVTMDSMAAAFDVSTSFLDEEVSNFIVAGRLNAKIDKVAGIIETNRPDAKNAQYQDCIKKGDLLLNRIQKLSKIIDVE